jgi:hypothetical protein
MLDALRPNRRAELIEPVYAENAYRRDEMLRFRFLPWAADRFSA